MITRALAAPPPRVVRLFPSARKFTSSAPGNSRCPHVLSGRQDCVASFGWRPLPRQAPNRSSAKSHIKMNPLRQLPHGIRPKVASRSILSSSTVPAAAAFSTATTRISSVARPVSVSRSAAVTPSLRSYVPTSFSSFQIRNMASVPKKIKVKNPVVEMDGDEVEWPCPLL